MDAFRSRVEKMGVGGVGWISEGLFIFLKGNEWLELKRSFNREWSNINWENGLVN